ncbi:MAG: PAS domain S-box protein [Salinivirgaceae bacterium]|nr:PAS domain S-box protein [Salinivirgaceae bacterium]
MKKDLNKTKEQLAIELEELRIESKKTEVELKAANQQLEANNQQLQASEQQLRAAKEKAEESERTFRKLFEDSADAILLINKKGVFVECNKAALDLLKMTREEFLFKTPADISPQYQPYGRTSEEAALQTIELVYKNGLHRFDWTCLNSKSEEFIVEVSLMPIGVKGETMLHCTWKDITERKRMEEDLRESEQRLNLSQMMGHQGNWELNLLNNKLFWSDEIYRIFEIDSSEFAASYEAFLNAIHPDDRERVNNEYTSSLKTKKQYEIDHRLLMPDGRIKYVHEYCKTFFDKEGSPLRSVGTIQDITERKQAEEKLQESESKLRNIFENSTNLFYSHTADHQITYINPQVEQILGYSAAEAMIKWTELASDNPINEIGFQNTVEAIETGERQPPYELELIRKDGKKIIVEVRESPLVENGKTMAMVGSLTDITERKQAEEALIEEKDRAQQYLNIAGTMLLALDTNGCVTLINQKGCDIVGDAEADILGLNFFDKYLSKDIVEIVKDSFKKTLTGEIEFIKDYENPIINSSGEERIISWNSTFLYDDKQNIIGMLNSGEDIIERKQAEEALLESEARWQFAVDGSALGLWDWNVQTSEVFFSKQWKAMLGFKDDEISESLEEWDKRLHPDDKEKVYADINKHLDGKAEFYNNEHRVLCKNNSYKWILDRGKVISQSDDGKPLRMIGTHTDITERKQAEEGLQKTHAKHASLIANIGDVIGIMGVDGIMKYKSPNIEKWFGWKPDDLVGTVGWETVHPEDIMRLQKEILTLLKKEDAITTVEYRYKCKDNTYKWIELTAVNCTNDSNIEGVLLNYHDITERRQAEKELIAAKDKAEESDRLKSAFLANMSHEIRTPMNGILGFAELLKKPNLSGDKQQKYINVIEKSGQRMLNTVNDIVEISKIEAGIVNVIVKETDLNKRVEELFHFFYAEAEKKGLKFILEMLLPAEKKNLSTDQNKLDSILTNLIKNAIKYTDSGTINMGWRMKDVVVEFYIKDTGIGIPTNRIEAIFNRFEQADIADTRAFQGSGLGLAISKSYVEMLGGKIWVESDPNGKSRGSTFYFTLPYNTDSSTETNGHQPVVSEKNKTVRKLKILIAEDDEVSEILLVETVEMFGKEILNASTGGETVEICRDNPDIDLILMDIRMPEMNGYEATKQIREFNKEIIIIAQTAYGLAGDREKAIESGCNDYIAKPINENELQSMIQKYFGK